MTWSCFMHHFPEPELKRNKSSAELSLNIVSKRIFMYLFFFLLQDTLAYSLTSGDPRIFFFFLRILKY